MLPLALDILPILVLLKQACMEERLIFVAENSAVISLTEGSFSPKNVSVQSEQWDFLNFVQTLESSAGPNWAETVISMCWKEIKGFPIYESIPAASATSTRGSKKIF